jgi:hypothetical protein
MQTIFRTILALAVAHTFSLGITPTSHAATIFTAVEIAGDVVITADGGASFDLTGLTLNSQSNRIRFINPTTGGFATGGTAAMDLYQGAITGPTQFGTGSFLQATSGDGSYAGILEGSFLAVPRDYTSDSLLGESTALYAGQTFATLGITPGTYVWSLPADSVTLDVVATVPIPGAVWLFGSAIGLLGWMRRKTA